MIIGKLLKLLLCMVQDFSWMIHSGGPKIFLSMTSPDKNSQILSGSGSFSAVISLAFGLMVTYSHPTSEIRFQILVLPQVGKLIVVCHVYVS